MTSIIDSLAETTAHRDRDDLNHAVGNLLLNHLAAESINIYLLIDDEGTKRLVRQVGLIRGGTQVPAHEAGDLAQLPTLRDVAAWQQCVAEHAAVQYTTPQGHYATVFPIESEREVIGLLEVEALTALAARDSELVIGVLRIVRNHLALLEYGERDTLTGLLNRKTFELTFGKLHSRANIKASQEAVEPSWLGIVDIDKFKTINDTYGHLFGDEVLLLMGQLLKQSFRGADQLFRFGGEEFIIVLERATAVGAEVAFGRLRAAVEGFRFPQVGRVTISLGYTQVNSLDAPGTCVERADAALYFAKHNGRNRVCNYEVLAASGDLVPKSKDNDIELF